MNSLRTLLVDDNPDFLLSAQSFLALDSRLEIVGVARSGREALQQVARLQPQVVLMDWEMPGMSGLETTIQLKRQPQPPYVVILTHHNHPLYRAAAKAAGADCFIAKEDFAQQLPITVAALNVFEEESEGKIPCPNPSNSLWPSV